VPPVPPRCAKDAQLGEPATDKLRALLNSGAVTMTPLGTSIDRDRDVYGRLLRNVAVDGADVGEAMVGAGVAREYAGGRRSWCDGYAVAIRHGLTLPRQFPHSQR